MAESPKSTNKDKVPEKASEKAAQSKPKPAKTPARTTKSTPKSTETPVEDAVVIGETPPEKTTNPTAKAATSTAAKTSGPASRATTSSAKADPKTPKPAETPARTAASVSTPKPDPKPAEPVKPAEAASVPPKSDPPKVEEPEKKRGTSGFLGLLLGGVAAAVIGFVAARTIVPDGWPFPGVTPEEDPLAGALEAQGAEIAALEDRIGALDATLAEVQSDTSALDDLRDSLSARLDTLETGAAGLEDRVSAVERLAPEGTAAAEMAAEAYAKELAELREMFEGELAEIDAAQAEATVLEAQLADAAQAASARSALARVSAALDTGEPFEEALGQLVEATGTDAPDALASAAASGVTTLSELQSSFPVAARAAIDADIRSGVEDGSMGRMQAFLQTQLGTRSLEPREGDSADAVLSRAEAALKAGDLDTVLAEIDTLPEAAAPAFADWRVLAQSRADALAAGDALAEELNAK